MLTIVELGIPLGLRKTRMNDVKVVQNNLIWHYTINHVTLCHEILTTGSNVRTSHEYGHLIEKEQGGKIYNSGEQRNGRRHREFLIFGVQTIGLTSLLKTNGFLPIKSPHGGLISGVGQKDN
jgi:hypothetical protein